MKPYQKKYKRKEGRTNTRWTDDEVDTLVNMYHTGASNWDIAKQLGRSHGAVTQRIYSMQLHKQPKRYETVSVALTTYDETPTVEKKPWWKRILGL